MVLLKKQQSIPLVLDKQLGWVHHRDQNLPLFHTWGYPQPRLQCTTDLYPGRRICPPHASYSLSMNLRTYSHWLQYRLKGSSKLLD